VLPKKQVNCLFLQVTLNNPDGLLHMDLEESNIDSTMRKMKVKPMIAFCPMNEDGCMLAIWTDGYNSWQKRDNLPGQYFLYVPFGVLIVLPGNCRHAGGFCFGGNNNSKLMPESHVLYMNPRLHFFFCPNQKTLDEMTADEVLDNQNNNEDKNNLYVDTPQKPVLTKYCLDLTKFKIHNAMLTATCCNNDNNDILEEETSDSDYIDNDSKYSENNKKCQPERNIKYW